MGCLSIPRSLIKVSGKLQQPHSGKTANGPDLFKNEGWVTPAGKETPPAEVLAEGTGHMECIVEGN